MNSLLKLFLSLFPYFSCKTPEQDPEVDLEAARGYESEGRDLPTHDRQDSIRGEDSNNLSPMVGLPEEASPDQARLHPVIKILRKQELAKHMFALTIPLATALLANQNPLSVSTSSRLFLILATIAFTALWIGNLLHDEYRFAKNIELLGYVLVLIAIFGAMASFQGFSLLAVIPLICLIASIIPLGRAFIDGIN